MGRGVGLVQLRPMPDRPCTVELPAGARYTHAAMRIRGAQPEDAGAAVKLAELVVGTRRAAEEVRAHLERDELLVAEDDGEVVGLLAYRTDWFRCTFASLVVVAERVRRRGVARALFAALEQRSPSARLFSSAEEANAASIQMHGALGFVPSGHIDNLPQGYRELLFYKRLPPSRSPW
jgi:GNAT superfamily N-acetyltransferase